VKAVVVYVTEYVTKPGLKTYSIFYTIQSVFNRNSELTVGIQKRCEKAKHLLTQIVNAFTAKLEIGGPMASLYLLKNPDHYTSHTFSTFYWKSHGREVRSVWCSPDESPDSHVDLVVIGKKDDEYVPVSSVDDYIYRSEKYADVSLCGWIRLAAKYKVNKHKSSATNDKEERNDPETDIEVNYSDDELANINTKPDIIKESPAHCVSSHKKNTTQNMMDSIEYENWVNAEHLCGNS
jgi:hypothetical protein